MREHLCKAGLFSHLTQRTENLFIIMSVTSVDISATQPTDKFDIMSVLLFWLHILLIVLIIFFFLRFQTKVDS